MDNNSSDKLSKFLASMDSDFISIKDVIELLHKKIGLDKDISQAYQALWLAIGKSEIKPTVYKKDKFIGWQKGVFTHAYLKAFRVKPHIQEIEKQHTLEIAIDIEKNERELNDLPF